MSDKFKQLGARLLLLITKSFLYLGTTLRERTPSSVIKTIKSFGWRVSYVALVAISPFYRVYRRVRRSLDRLLDNPSPWLRPLSHRYALHALILVVAGVSIYSNVNPVSGAENFGEGRLVLQILHNNSSSDIPGFLPTIDPEQEGIDDTLGTTDDVPPQPLMSYTGESVFQPYLPTTANSVAPRQRIEEYIVQNGDTPAGIAAKFHLQLSTLLQTNNLGLRALIRPGQKLTILPVDGLTHTVQRGENISSIAKRYQVTADSILSYNRIPGERSIVAGQTLIVPGGKPVPAPTPSRPSSGSNVASVPRTPAVDSGTKLLWPTVSHRINQYFTWSHHALDIHGTMGTSIYAAESGVVLESRWGGAYGNMVLIRHDNGIVTRYGHHSKNLVAKGDRVERGEVIALMGSTGRSTGPHLHFEVIVGRSLVNPLSYTR